MSETDLIKERYSRRDYKNRYSLINPDIYFKFQERQRKIIELLKKAGRADIKNLSVLEVGCGTGTNLLELILLGFSPDKLTGIDLINERIDEAKSRLPESVKLIVGDALIYKIDQEFDIVYLSTVFSSILDDKFQSELAEKIWKWVKPGGAILWYDFIYNNPQNPDVRGINYRTLKKLFPHGHIEKSKITLAPPLARKLVKAGKMLYSVFNLFLPLRTHLLCWIEKNE